MNARRKKPRDRDLDLTQIGSPAQQDEADVLAEADAEQDEASGEMFIDEKAAQALGAVDAESVIENRRVEDIVSKKRANIKDVPFNVSDLLPKYEGLIKLWPPNTLDIHVRRLTGTPIERVIISRPRSGVELYKAMEDIHGICEEAKYQIRFFDSTNRVFRGSGQIVMRDTRPPPQQQGQPMQPPYYPQYGYPPGYVPPPGYQPPPASGAPPVPQQAAPAQPMPQAPPVVVHAPPGPDMQTMMASLQQMLEMFGTMRERFAPPPTAPPQAQPPAYFPPPPPQTADMPTMMAWMRQMFEIVQSMQPPAAPPQRGGGEQAMPNPMAAMGMPRMQPPPGMMWVPGFGFVSVDALMRAMGVGGGEARPGPSAFRRPPYSADHGGAHSPYAPPTREAPPQREKTAAETFREALTTLRTAADAVEEFRSMAGGGAQYPAQVSEPSVEDDDSPISIVDMGPAKAVINKENGSIRPWETIWANSDKIFKFVTEQHEILQKANVKQREEERRLPPGFVRMNPGDQPPPGFTAVPVDPRDVPPVEQGFAPPPAHVPPPVAASQAWPTPPTYGQGER